MNSFEFEAMRLPDFVNDEQGPTPCSQTDPDSFYPEIGRWSERTSKTQDIALVKRVCAGCVYREPCLTWAIENNEEYGIWGGLLPSERRKIKMRKNVQLKFVKVYPQN